MSSSSPIAAAQALAAPIRIAAEAIESGRRLPLELVHQMATHGFFRMCVPRVFGGLEVDVATLWQTIEAVAVADASAGWCVMIGSTSALPAAYLAEDTARAIYSSADTICGGVFAPIGKAVVVDGGYRVSGRWPFASGCQHCTWLLGGSVVIEDGEPRLLANGAPETRMMLFAAGQAEILDTWEVSGLRGTGSHDIVVRDLFVPRSHSISFVDDPVRHDGRLYKFPVFGLLALGIAAVAVGTARRAIDELCDLAARKTPGGSRRKLGDRAIVQSQVAQAEATLRSARAFVLETIAHTWEQAGTTTIDLPQRALLRLAASHATNSAVQVVDAMYTAAGGTAIYANHPLQRCLRDVHVATQHMMVAQPTYELTGRVLLGIDTDTSLL